MPILQCYVDERTLGILRQIAETTGRAVEDLAEAAIENEALAALRDGQTTEPRS